MTRTNLQLAKTDVRNPPVYFCRQCIAVRVFEEGGVCPTCVNVEKDIDKFPAHLQIREFPNV